MILKEVGVLYSFDSKDLPSGREINYILRHKPTGKEAKRKIFVLGDPMELFKHWARGNWEIVL